MSKLLIGCTILRAVSGILRTQCGRRGSGPRETTSNRPAAQLLAPVARPSPPWLNYRPCGTAPALAVQRPRGSSIAPAAQLPLSRFNCRPCGSALAPVAQLQPRGPKPLLLAPVAQLPAPVARLPHTWPAPAFATSHGPWAVCLGSSLPCQIKPGPSYAAVVIGVQRGAGLSWRDCVWLPARRALYFSWAASGG